LEKELGVEAVVSFLCAALSIQSLGRLVGERKTCQYVGDPEPSYT